MFSWVFWRWLGLLVRYNCWSAWAERRLTNRFMQPLPICQLHAPGTRSDEGREGPDMLTDLVRRPQLNKAPPSKSWKKERERERKWPVSCSLCCVLGDGSNEKAAAAVAAAAVATTAAPSATRHARRRRQDRRHKWVNVRFIALRTWVPAQFLTVSTVTTVVGSSSSSSRTPPHLRRQRSRHQRLSRKERQGQPQGQPQGQARRRNPARTSRGIVAKFKSVLCCSSSWQK